MRHGLSILASATGAQSNELMHLYYAMTMFTPAIGLGVAAVLIFKDMLVEQGKAAEEARKKTEELHKAVAKYEEDRQKKSREIFEGADVSKNREELAAREKEIANLRREQDKLLKKDADYEKAVADARKVGGFGGGFSGVGLTPGERDRVAALKEEIELKNRQYIQLQNQTDGLAEAHKQELIATEGIRDVELEIAQENLKGVDALARRAEIKREEVDLAEEAMNAETDAAQKLEKKKTYNEKLLDLYKLQNEAKDEEAKITDKLAKKEADFAAHVAEDAKAMDNKVRAIVEANQTPEERFNETVKNFLDLPLDNETLKRASDKAWADYDKSVNTSKPEQLSSVGSFSGFGGSNMGASGVFNRQLETQQKMSDTLAKIETNTREGSAGMVLQ
jgi:hypothetical protein